MRRGPWQVLLAMDRLLNALAWGDGRQTISGRAGYAHYRKKRWGKVAVSMIDALFGPGHCFRQAIREGLIHG